MALNPPTPEPGSAEDLALSEQDRRIVERALPFTMTGQVRLAALIDAVRYCVRSDVGGAFAECGVWRGGSILAVVLTLQELGIDDRDLFLYDTFTGMTEPTEHDTSPYHASARAGWTSAGERGGRIYPELFDESMFDEDSVRETLLATGYPADRIRIVAGPVEQTIPASAPAEIALLRLDTDWYESTRHELEYLYPLLAAGGVLIIDDYGHWDGARRAVDEYFTAHRPAPLLNRIDYTGRIAVKP